MDNIKTLKQLVENNIEEEKLIDIFLKLCDVVKVENKVVTPDNVFIEKGNIYIDKNADVCDNVVYDLGCTMDIAFGENYKGRMRVVIDKCKDNKYESINKLKFDIFFNRYKNIIIIALWVCAVALIAKYRYIVLG